VVIDSCVDGLPDPGPHSGRGANPLNRWLIAAYRPLLNIVLRALANSRVAAALFAVSALPLRQIGVSLPTPR
jgi:Cu/Ag efflux pump CusA